MADGANNTACARRLAQEVVSRDDCTLREALLADAIGHLADELDRQHPAEQEPEGCLAAREEPRGQRSGAEQGPSRAD